MRSLRLETNTLVSVILFCVLILATNQIGLSQYVCQPQGAPVVVTGSITAADGVQTTRINRDGTPSSCTGGAPVAAPVNGSFNFDQHPFTNPTGAEACVTVDYNMTACGGTGANFSTQVNAYSTFAPATPNVNVIGEPGFSTTGSGTLLFKVAAGASFVVVVHATAATPAGVCNSYSLTVKYRTNCREAGFDKSNDGKADPTYFRPSSGTWNVLNSAGGATSLPFGASTDIITAGDYTGDGQTDLSTYRPTANTWYYATDQSNPSSNIAHIPWGTTGDVPVPGDYDSDGKTDVAVWRPSDGRWYALRSSNNTVQQTAWGTNGDTPITGDYDGDLITDFAIVRNVSGQLRWWILNSNFNYGFFYGCGTTTPTCALSTPWGAAGDRPVSGDFDGDARTDIAVFRPSDGNWYFLKSSVGLANAPSFTTGPAAFAWGTSGDIPQPADYDGDKRTDFAVFRPSLGQWFISNSNNGTYNTFSAPVWGASTDQPATSPYRITNP